MTTFIVPQVNYTNNPSKSSQKLIPSLGTGPSPTAEQNRQVITVTPEDNIYIRGNTEQLCLRGNFNNLDNSPQVYGIVKGEPIFGIRHPYPGVRYAKNGAPFQKGFSALNNIKASIADELFFIGIAQTAGAAHGESDSIQMQEFTVAIGGTQQICFNNQNSSVMGPCCIVPYALTKIGSRGSSCVPLVQIRGIPVNKMIGQVIMIHDKDVDVNFNFLSFSIKQILYDEFNKNNNAVNESVLKVLCNKLDNKIGGGLEYIQEYVDWAYIELASQLMAMCNDRMINGNSNDCDLVMHYALGAMLEWQTRSIKKLSAYQRINDEKRFPISRNVNEIKSLRWKESDIDGTTTNFVYTLNKLREVQKIQHYLTSDFMRRFYAGIIAEPCAAGGSTSLLIKGS